MPCMQNQLVKGQPLKGRVVESQSTRNVSRKNVALVLAILLACPFVAACGDSRGDTCPGGCPAGERCDPVTRTCHPFDAGQPLPDAGGCGPDTRLCDGVCAPCPTPIHVRSFTCNAAECVAESCEDGYEVCSSGCCPIDTSVIALGANMRAPSLALDSTGAPHVSFLIDAYGLSYAHLGASGWDVASITNGSNAYGTAIAVGPDDRPLVAYSANYALGLARYGEPWSHEEVFASSQGYGPSLYQQALALDTSGNPQIAAGQEWAGSTTYGARVMHFAWDGSAWQRRDLVEYVDNRISMPALAIAGGVLHVTWVSYFDDLVRYATTAGG
ncbi:MAG: hypothetical protein K8H88_16790, partial [Sandaracinaceae bacterium]|nr:hypothetical protein [Sandaracinaceae bacterium]